MRVSYFTRTISVLCNRPNAVLYKFQPNQIRFSKHYQNQNAVDSHIRNLCTKSSDKSNRDNEQFVEEVLESQRDVETKQETIPKEKKKKSSKSKKAASKKDSAEDKPKESVSADEVEVVTEEDLESKLASREADFNEMKDKYFRTLAEMESLRKRTKIEIEKNKTFAIQGFTKDLLVIADNLSMALENVETSGQAKLMEGDSDECKALKNLHEGLVITQKAMLGVFKNNHITPMKSLGAKFDPNFHDCLFELPTPDKEAGTIVKVVKEGYMLHDRVIRPAQVGTSREP